MNWRRAATNHRFFRRRTPLTARSQESAESPNQEAGLQSRYSHPNSLVDQSSLLDLLHPHPRHQLSWDVSGKTGDIDPLPQRLQHKCNYHKDNKDNEEADCAPRIPPPVCLTRIMHAQALQMLCQLKASRQKEHLHLLHLGQRQSVSLCVEIPGPRR